MAKIKYLITNTQGAPKEVEGERFTRLVHGKKQVFALRRLPDAHGDGFVGWGVDHVRTGWGAGKCWFGTKDEMKAVFDLSIGKLTSEQAQVMFDTPTLNEEYA